MNFPTDLRYTKEHEWIRLEADGKTATIGVTDFAQHELGDIVFVELQPEGTELAEGAVFGTVEAVKTVSELFMPVAGTLREHNPDLDGSPELVNSDPYGKGWMVRIELSNPADLDALMSPDAYSGMVAK